MVTRDSDVYFDFSDCGCAPCEECGALHGHWSGCAQSTDPDAEITREWRRPSHREAIGSLDRHGPPPALPERR